MKKAVLLNGTDNKATDHWFPWLKSELEAQGYEVFCPDLPGNHTPDREVYEQFLRGSGWDFTDNILIGYSSGATTALNLLMSDWFPRVRATVLVGTFLNEKLTKSADWYEEGQFDQLFMDEYKPEIIKPKSEKFIFVHGDDDYNCDINDARVLCEQLEGDFLTVQSGGHLGTSSDLKQLPGLMDKLKEVL